MLSDVLRRWARLLLHVPQVKGMSVEADNDTYEKSYTDKVFEKFSKRMGRYPKQCLRCCGPASSCSTTCHNVQ